MNTPIDKRSSNDKPSLPGTACRLLAVCLLCFSAQAGAHGGVSLSGDQCIIQIDFFQAHFAVYQPETSANREFCEDLPDVTHSIFVLDYLHKSLKEMPVDFRIIRDINEFGRFATWEQVEGLGDLDEITEFYRSPVVRPDAVFTVEHEFNTSGNYIGIVTTRLPDSDKIYRALFPFEVGKTGIGYLPLFIALVLLVQVNYWVMTGGYKRWRARRSQDESAEG